MDPTEKCSANDCDKTFPDKTAFDKHWDLEHSEILLKRCHFCGFESRQRSVVEEHIFQSHSKRPIIQAIQCHKCCAFRATSEDLIKFHTIEDCTGKRLRVESTSPTKMKITNKSFACHLCKYRTEDSLQLGEHLVNKHLVSCSFCNFKAVCQNFISEHVTETHPEKSKTGKEVANERTLQKAIEKEQVIEEEQMQIEEEKSPETHGNGSEDDASEKENVVSETHRYPKRIRKFKESESNALSSRKPLRAKVHKRQRNASEQEQITTSKRQKNDKDEKEDDKEQKKDKAPIVIPLSPRARTVEELRREFPKDFERCTDSHLREQELYLPRDIKQQLRGRRCLTCDYLGPQRFDTVRHILLRHLRLKDFPCNNCEQEFHKLGDLKRHFLETHGEEKEPILKEGTNADVDTKSPEVAVKTSENVSSTIITADIASVAVTAVISNPIKLKDLGKNAESNISHIETTGESSATSNNENRVKTAKNPKTAKRNLSWLLEDAADNQPENTNESEILSGSESNEDDDKDANLNDEEKCEKKKKSSINAHFVQTSGDDNLPLGDPDSKMQEGKTANLNSPVESELTPRKRPLLKKTTARQDSRKLYKLVMKTVLNEDSTEASFKRLVPVVKKFYTCHVCQWKFELSDEHKKHLLESHGENVTNTDDNTQNDMDTVEDRSENLPESTTAATDDIGTDESDEEETPNNRENCSKIINIRKQILREQLSKNYQCSVCK